MYKNDGIDINKMGSPNWMVKSQLTHDDWNADNLQLSQYKCTDKAEVSGHGVRLLKYNL